MFGWCWGKRGKYIYHDIASSRLYMEVYVVSLAKGDRRPDLTVREAVEDYCKFFEVY